MQTLNRSPDRKQETVSGWSDLGTAGSVPNKTMRMGISVMKVEDKEAMNTVIACGLQTLHKLIMKQSVSMCPNNFNSQMDKTNLQN